VSFQFVKHEVISLKNHPGFSEKWLQDVIADDPTILGLGDLEVIDRERAQEHSGRLDLLLTDGEGARYEAELMLGATDPSHIIRCIEYWDGERRRYPGYEHIAVLIAEDITTRFLNVMSLMAGNIPLIAIQLCALKVGENLVLNFVPVLNQTALRRDDEGDQGGQEVDRSYWDARVGPAIMAIADGLLKIVREDTASEYRLKYLKGHVGVSEVGDWRNVLGILPKKQYLHFRIRVDGADEWMQRIEEVGLPVTKRRQNRLQVTVNPKQFQQYHDLLRELIRAASREDAEAS
jgi:hypothetical protein